MTSSFLPSMTSIATSVSGMMGQPAPQGVGGLSALSMSGFMAKESLLSNVAKPALLGFKIGGAIGGGFAEKYALKTQARDAELQAKQEELNALSQQNFFQESLIENFAQQTAKLAARGILTTGPSAYAFAGRSARNVTRDIEAAKYSGKIRSEQNKREASSFRSASKQAVKSGIGKAFSFLAGEL
jgi:hypothetical protein